MKMIEEGVLDDIDYLYGVHVRPIQETQNGRCAPSILHGSSQHIEGTIIGEEAHGTPVRTSGKTALKLRHFLYISSDSFILTRKSRIPSK
nr:hypothetical protein P5651_01430 [Bacillus subtilis]